MSLDELAGICDGVARGLPLFVIGGGPSVKGLDLSRISGFPRIAVNMSFVLGADVVLIGDSKVRRELIPSSPDLVGAWADFRGLKIMVRFEQEAVKPEDVPDMVLVPAVEKWTTSLRDGLIRSTNTGMAAINLADVMRPWTIFLLGFDLVPVEPLTSNWHDFYKNFKKPDDYRSHAESVYQNMMTDFLKRCSPRSPVVNCNRDSRLRMFPFSTFDDAVLAAQGAMK
jgi:hypothetical protein